MLLIKSNAMNKISNTNVVPMKEQLINFLNGLEYRFEIREDSEERTVIQTGISLTVGASDGYIVIHNKISLVEILAYSPVNIPENKRSEVAKFMDIVDSITYVGNLQLNHVSGGVRCKTYFLHASEMVSLEIIKDNFFEAFNILERYMPGIMAIVYAGKDADTVINDLLGTVNPTNN
jgi:hypothetical protein